MIAILATVLVIASAAVILNQHGDRSDGSLLRSSVPYKDIDGSEKYCTDPIELTSTYLTSVGYELDTGWYVSNGYTSFSKAIKIVGDVNIILAGETSVVNKGIIIQKGKSLTLYGQGGSFDTLSSSGTCIEMNGGSLINAASIRNTSANKALVSVPSGSGNTITNYGTISVSQNGCTAIESEVDITIVNFGAIKTHGSSSYAVYCKGNVTITNNSNGAITSSGSLSTVIFAHGGKLINSGEIRSTGSFGFAVHIQGSATVINNENGLIRASIHNLSILGVGDVTNSGKIGDLSCAGNGLYIGGGKVMNGPKGMILGAQGISSDGSAEIINSGQIGGSDKGVEISGSSKVVLVNKNLISGGVYLQDETNHVTFGAGSRIYGNFNMGSDPASTLTFVGAPDSTLTYTNIDGSADIGTKNVFVDIDSAGLPASLVPGKKLILINATGTVSGTPKNSTVLSGGYDFSLSIESNRKLVAGLKALPSYGIAISPNEHTFPSAVFGYGPQTPVTVTVTNTGTVSTGGLIITVTGPNPGYVDLNTTSFINIAATAGSNYDEFIAVPYLGLAAGTYKATVTVSPAPGNTNPIDPVSIDLFFTVDPPAIGHHEYYITATSDPGSTITPKGTVIVEYGKSQKFTFSALHGYSISAVMVDGMPLTQEKVEQGFYTFFDVHSNHTIQVFSTETEVFILTIAVAEGEGHATFSVNGGPFQKYVSPVLIPDGASLMTIAYGEDGFRFSQWKFDYVTYKEPDAFFFMIGESLHMDVYFIEDDNGNTWLWKIGFIVLLGLIGFLFWFLVYYRRRYNVYIMNSDVIIGKDKVRRKKKYIFTTAEGYTGPVLYRIKEDGERKTVHMNLDGRYVIPRKEIIGDIYLELLR